MHVNRPFSGRSVVHMPRYLPVLLCVVRPLHSKRGGEGTVTWGTFPRGCEGTVARRCFFYKGGRGYKFTTNPRFSSESVHWKCCARIVQKAACACVLVEIPSLSLIHPFGGIF